MTGLAWRREARKVGGLTRSAYASAIDWVGGCNQFGGWATRELHRKNGPKKVLEVIVNYLRDGTRLTDARAVSVLAKLAGIDRRWARRCLEELERLGLVARLYKHGWRGRGQRGWATSVLVVPALLPMAEALPRARRAAALLELRAPLLRGDLNAWIGTHRPDLRRDVDRLLGAVPENSPAVDNRAYSPHIGSEVLRKVSVTTKGSETPLPPYGPEFSTLGAGGAVAPSPPIAESLPGERAALEHPGLPDATVPSGSQRGGWPWARDTADRKRFRDAPWPHGRFRSGGAELRADVGSKRTMAKRRHEELGGAPPGRRERHRAKARAVLRELEAIRREKGDRGEGDE